MVVQTRAGGSVRIPGYTYYGGVMWKAHLAHHVPLVEREERVVPGPLGFKHVPTGPVVRHHHIVAGSIIAKDALAPVVPVHMLGVRRLEPVQQARPDGLADVALLLADADALELR